jgi:hypothetical protein
MANPDRPRLIEQFTAAGWMPHAVAPTCAPPTTACTSRRPRAADGTAPSTDHP